MAGKVLPLVWITFVHSNMVISKVVIYKVVCSVGSIIGSTIHYWNRKSIFEIGSIVWRLASRGACVHGSFVERYFRM